MDFTQPLICMPHQTPATFPFTGISPRIVCTTQTRHNSRWVGGYALLSLPALWHIPSFPSTTTTVLMPTCLIPCQLLTRYLCSKALTRFARRQDDDNDGAWWHGKMTRKQAAVVAVVVALSRAICGMSSFFMWEEFGLLHQCRKMWQNPWKTGPSIKCHFLWWASRKIRMIKADTKLKANYDPRLYYRKPPPATTSPMQRNGCKW